MALPMVSLTRKPLVECTSAELAERPCYRIAKKLLSDASQEALIEAAENLEAYVQALYRIYIRLSASGLLKDIEEKTVMQQAEERDVNRPLHSSELHSRLFRK